MAILIGVCAILATLIVGNLADAQSSATTMSTHTPALSTAEQHPPPLSVGGESTSLPVKVHAIQIGVTESAALGQQWTKWLNDRGCNQQELAGGAFAPEEQLRAKVRAGDLTAMGSLALQLIWDGDHDGRTEAKTLLHKAILLGSTCALATHDLYLLKAEQGIRTVERDIHGRKWAKYTLPIPKTKQEQERNIMNAYAWDLVYEMRTGLTRTLGNASTEFASRYHDMGFRPSAADYKYACQLANRIYQTLQDEREAEGLGPFDDTPPPFRIPIVALAEALIKYFTDAIVKANPAAKSHIQSGVSQITRNESFVETGSHCAHWPAPRTRWKLAELHHMQHDGKITSNFVWIPAAPAASSKLNKS